MATTLPMVMDMVMAVAAKNGKKSKGKRLKKLGSGLGLMSCMAHAWAMGWQVTPSINASETWSDNVGLSSSGGGRSSDFITEVTPAISIAGQSARIKAHVDAQLQNFFYMDNSQENRSSLRLQAGSQVELVEKHFFVNANASSSQERVSLLGVSANDQNISNNRSTVQTFSINPFVPFQIGDKGQGMVGYSLDWIDSSSSELSRVTTQTWSTSLVNGSAFGRLGWGFDAKTSHSDYQNAVDVDTQMARFSVLYAFAPQFRMRMTEGYEHNDYAEAGHDGGNTYGIGFDWTPSPRLAVSGYNEKRFFGTGYNYSIQYQRARSVFAFSYVKDASTSRQSGDSDITDTPEFILLRNIAFDSIVSVKGRPADVATYNAYVDAATKGATEFAKMNGIKIKRDTPLQVFANIYVLQRRLQASAAWLGIRNTVTFDVLRAERQNIDNRGIEEMGDFTIFEKTRENTARISWTSRLTPATNLNTALSFSKTEGEGTSDSADLRQMQLSVGSSTSLGPKTSGGLSYRHLRTRGTSDVNENAVTATLSHRF